MDFTGKRIVIMGLGRFGGGVGVAKFLASRNARLLVTDTASESALTNSLDKLAGLPIDYRLGEHHESDFTSADLVVVNPAVDLRNNIYIAAAKNAGVDITSEIQILITHLPNPQNVIAITGSAGKSTVTAMVGCILEKTLDPSAVHVGGNLGGSLLENLDSIHADHYVVLELSSFMLDLLDADRWSPHIAVVTNIAENHLDRHGDMANYIHAKQTIIRYQSPNDIAILPEKRGRESFSPRPCVEPWQTPAKTHYITQPTTNYPLLIPGQHNQLNAHFAYAAANAALPEKTLDQNLLADFPGLPHRLQFICERNDIRYYNDSKSTTPDAAILAINSFPDQSVHIILGGSDKGSDFTKLAKLAAKKCAAVYTIADTGPAIAKLCNESNPDAKIFELQTLEQAFAATRENAITNQNIVLSPSCASFDQFTNYEKRGQTFIGLCEKD